MKKKTGSKVKSNSKKTQSAKGAAQKKAPSKKQTSGISAKKKTIKPVVKKTAPKKALAKKVAKSAPKKPAPKKTTFKKPALKKNKNTAQKKLSKPAMSKNLKKSKTAPKKTLAKKPVKAAPKKPLKKLVSKPAPKKAPVKQAKPLKKTAPKKPVAKQSKPAAKQVKPVAKKTPAKVLKSSAKAAPKKTAPQKPAPKKAELKPVKKSEIKPAKKQEKAKAETKVKTKAAAQKSSASKKNESKKATATKDNSKTILPEKGSVPAEVPSKPAPKMSMSIYFSLEDLDSFLDRKKNMHSESESQEGGLPKVKGKILKGGVSKVVAKPVASSKTVGVASIEDLLGFNLFEEPSREKVEEKDIPRKWKKYYSMLISMRKHFSSGAEARAEEVLKRSAKEDSGDLSSYGQHLADAGSESFERDMAYCLLSTEKETIDEIDAAIERMKEGTYGVCELTGKPIPEARLKAVPFTRYTIEGQRIKDKENSRRRDDRGQFSPFGEITTGDGTVEDVE